MRYGRHARTKAPVLVTSREPLRIAGEHLVEIGPLPIEDGVALYRQHAGDADRRAVADEPQQHVRSPTGLGLVAAGGVALGSVVLLLRRRVLTAR